MAAIRESDGRISSQARAKEGADLVELPAYSGRRRDEASYRCWQDVSFEHRRITITGGQRGTKNHEIRTVPMTDALARLLERIHKEIAPQPADLVIRIRSARKCIETACRRLGFATYSHHDFHHFFATTCNEAGVDIPTVSRWLGHKDGGALAMRVYGPLRQEHSFSQIRLVDFASPPQRPDSQSPAKESTGDHAMLPGAPVSVSRGRCRGGDRNQRRHQFAHVAETGDRASPGRGLTLWNGRERGVEQRTIKPIHRRSTQQKLTVLTWTTRHLRVACRPIGPGPLVTDAPRKTGAR